MAEESTSLIQPCGNVKRLDHLPLIAQILKDLRVAEIVDSRVPPHPDRCVSVGTCIEAMVLTILMGSHTLDRVGEALRTWDLGVLVEVTPPGPMERGYRPPEGAPRIGRPRRNADAKKPSRTWVERRTRR